MKNKGLIAGAAIVTLFFLVSFILKTVTCGEALDALKVLYSYSGYYPYYTTLKTIIALSIVAYSVSMFFLLIMLLVSAIKGYSKAAIALSISVAAIYSLFAIIADIVGMSELGATLEGISIAILVFEILMAIFAFFGFLVYLSGAYKGGATMSCLAFFCLILLLIFSLVEDSDLGNAKNIISFIFLLIGALGMIILIGSGTYYQVMDLKPAPLNESNEAIIEESIESDEKEELAVDTPSPVKEEPVKEPVKKEENSSAVKKLKELKSLLDEGVITEEEYKAKRQKYVDLL